jgi:ribosome recycling factor
MESEHNKKKERTGDPYRPDSLDKKDKTYRQVGKSTGKARDTAHDRLKQALEPYEKTLANEPDNASAWAGKAAIYLRHRMYKDSLKAIEKALNASDLGMPPQNDGKTLRLIFPQLTEERRHDLTKQVDKMGEDAKIALRNIRREANDKCKDLKKSKEMTEDEQKQSEKTVQDLTDKFIKDIEKITAAKNKEIMTL